MGRNKKVKKETKEQVEKEAKRVAYFDYHLYQKETNYKCMVIDGKWYPRTENGIIGAHLTDKCSIPETDITPGFGIDKSEKDNIKIESELNELLKYDGKVNNWYINIHEIIKLNPWCRNLMIITQRETGKSTSSRELLTKWVLDSDSVLWGILNAWNDPISNRRRASWWRKTMEAMKSSIIPKFTKICNQWNKENHKNLFTCNLQGVFKYGDDEPIILFVNCNTPDNYKDTNLKCRINIFDEFLEQKTDLKESTIIPDELNTYINIYNSITRSWFQNDDKEDVPFFIMLSNPEKKPYSALFDLFQCDFNWDDANVKNQYIINKKYRFIGIWTAPFKLPNKTYSLGRIENISNIYPFLRESNKKVIFWENVKDYFDEIIGLHIAKTTIILGLVLINNVKCLYGREIRYEDYVREKINHKQEQVTFFCDDWEDKEDFNEKDKSGFDILINYYSISKVYASTEWSLEKLNKKAVQLLKKDKELR